MDEQAPPSLINERIARLERIVFWHNVGWCLLLPAIFGWLVPPIGELFGFVLLILCIGGGLIVFIASIMHLLDRLFPGQPPTS